MGLILSLQTTKYDPNVIMTILNAFQRHSNSHWRRTVSNYANFTGSGTASWRLIFTRDDDDIMRSVRLENKCESSYRIVVYTVGSQGDVYFYNRPDVRKLLKHGD